MCNIGDSKSRAPWRSGGAGEVWEHLMVVTPQWSDKWQAQLFVGSGIIKEEWKTNI
jgi:hypothetical protein